MIRFLILTILIGIVFFTADYYKKKSDTDGIASNLFTNYKSDAKQQQNVDRTQFTIDHIYRPNDFITESILYNFH